MTSLSSLLDLFSWAIPFSQRVMFITTQGMRLGLFGDGCSFLGQFPFVMTNFDISVVDY